MENGHQLVRVGLSERNCAPLIMYLYMSENEEESEEKKLYTCSPCMASFLEEEGKEGSSVTLSYAGLWTDLPH